jgi:hypothetical protein
MEKIPPQRSARTQAEEEGEEIGEEDLTVAFDHLVGAADYMRSEVKQNPKCK